MINKLQKIHAHLMRNRAEFYKERSKKIDEHFVLVSFNKFGCMIIVYKDLKRLNNKEKEEFFNKNGKEIQDLFMYKWLVLF